MTVKELIEVLKDLDPNTRVFVKGYEGGVDDLITIKEHAVVLNVNSEWYYGKHEMVGSNTVKQTKKNSVSGVILS